MTEKLYYQDAYRKEFTAVVQQVVCEDGQIRIQLDQTAFYPEGGGQGADKGVLWMLHGAVTCAGRDGVNPGTTQTMSETRFLPEEISEEIGFLVTDVQERDGEIWHYISACLPKKTLAASMAETDGILAKGQKNQKTELPVGEQPKPLLLCPGQQVWGQIDWERRFDHMQQHSGEHIISGMICRRFHCDNVGFHMGEDAVTVDFNARISYEQALEIEAQANAYIWEDHPFQELWPTQKELEHLEYRSKKELPGAVRITCFPGADSCACCGTHVSGSAQIGLVKFLSAKPFHDGTRLELLCGKRAFDYLSMNYYENKAAAVLLSAHEFHTAEYVRKMLDDNLRQKAANAALKDHLLHQWAESFRGQGERLDYLPVGSQERSAHRASGLVQGEGHASQVHLCRDPEGRFRVQDERLSDPPVRFPGTAEIIPRLPEVRPVRDHEAPVWFPAHPPA